MDRQTKHTNKTIVVEAFSARSGGGVTYLMNILTHYSPVEGEKIYLIVNKSISLSAPENVELVQAPIIVGLGPFSYLVYWLWLRTFMKSVDADVLYSPGGSLPPLPFRRLKKVVAFRNMLPFAKQARVMYPLGYTRLRVLVLKYYFLFSFRRADLIIFISQYAQRVVNKKVTKKQSEQTVIPHGINSIFREKASLPEQFSLPDRYVLYVSTIDVYKAQIELVRAWGLLLEKEGPREEKLVLIGSKYPPYAKKVKREIQHLDIQNEVIMLGNIPYKHLPGIYQNATVNIFASSCENCPNILLECLASGRPVVSSNYEPMPEFAQNGALYVDPYDPQQLFLRLSALLNSKSLRSEWSEKALERSQKYDWSTSAQKTWSALREV